MWNKNSNRTKIQGIFFVGKPKKIKSYIWINPTTRTTKFVILTHKRVATNTKFIY